MAQQEEKLPEWMLRLESKRNRRNRLAHEIGAGAPCFVCGDSCPGLDLHFWRKLCRNCKCKKEDHDVKDDDGYEQFEILLGSGPKKKKGGFLKLKVPDDVQSPVVLYEGGSKGVSFDWLPPNVSDEMAVEYMQQLPVSKLPISGSDGALYRKQQLEKQVPLHDLDAKHCHNLTPEEIDQLMKYLDNLKSNVVGQGCVGKVPLPYSEARPSIPGPTAMVAGSQSLGRSLPTSQSADTLRPLPPMPPAYNSAPRPFHPTAMPGIVAHAGEDLPPPLPSSLPPRGGLKTPSDFFVDWRLPEEKRSNVGQVTDNLSSMTLHSQGGAGSHFIKENFPAELSVSSQSGNLVPQYSSNLPLPEHHAASFGRKTSETATLVGGRPVGAAGYMREMLDVKKEAISGAMSPSGVIMGSVHSGALHVAEPLPSDGTLVSTALPSNVAYSSDGSRLGISAISKPMKSSNLAHGGTDGAFDSLRPLPSGGIQVSSVMLADIAQSSEGNRITEPGISRPLGGNIAHAGADSSGDSLKPLPSDGKQVSSVLSEGIAHSSQGSGFGVHGMARPLGGHLGADGSLDSFRSLPSDGKQISSTVNAGMTLSSNGSRHGVLGSSEPLDSSADPSKPESCGTFPASSVKDSTLYPSGTVHSTVGSQQGVPGISQSLFGGTKGLLAHSDGHSSHNPNFRPLPYGHRLESGMAATDLHNPPSSLNIEGVVTSNVFPHNIVHSSSVGTDALPKSAQAMQQNTTMVDPSSAGICAGTSETLPAETPGGSVAPHLECHECSLDLHAGDVAVFAERASSAAWHPGCFVCSTCKELLVDLMYFYHKGKVYCGRHFADLLGIPRCFACDELIFVKEYTVAEGKAFHVKHFCCYECDEPLGGKHYIPVEEQPVCLECYERTYGKQCHTCQKKIGAGDQRVNWKHLNWHVQGNCFCCFECAKSLLGGRFVVKEDQPFCSKECVQIGLSKMAGAA